MDFNVPPPTSRHAAIKPAFAVDFTAETGIAVDVQFKGRTGIREGLQPALDAGTNIDLFDEDIGAVFNTASLSQSPFLTTSSVAGSPIRRLM